MSILIKTLIINISAYRPKLIKVRPHDFLKILKLQEINNLYFVLFWPLGRDMDDFCLLQVFTFGWNHLKINSLFPKDCTVIFKVNNQHPSDMVRFWRVTKSEKKIIKSTDCMIPLNHTIQRWQRYTPNKTWYRSFIVHARAFVYGCTGRELSMEWIDKKQKDFISVQPNLK